MFWLGKNVAPPEIAIPYVIFDRLRKTVFDLIYLKYLSCQLNP